MVVYARAHDVRPYRYLYERARAVNRLLAEIGIEVFGLDRHFRQDERFHPAAESPAGQASRAAEPDNAGEALAGRDLSKGHATGDVKQPAVPCVAEPRPRRPE